MLREVELHTLPILVALYSDLRLDTHIENLIVLGLPMGHVMAIEEITDKNH